MLCCKNYRRIGFGIFLSVSLVVFSGLFFFTTNVSAVDPISVSSSSVVNNSPLFSDCSTSSCLSHYSWLHVHTDTFASSSTTYFQLVIRFPNTQANTGDFRVYSSQSDAYYYIGGITNLRSANGFSLNAGNSVVTFTLLESLPAPDCPACQECPVCPAIPENPYDDKLDAIVVAIYSCGAILFVIYFFYCFYRLFIHFSRGRS